MEENPSNALTIASTAERASAFFADLLILSHLFFALLIGLKLFMNNDVLHPWTLNNGEKFLFLTSAGVLFFLYYLLFEGVFTASPGKLLAGLTVRTNQGGIPSLFAIVIRTLLRAIDYPLFFLTVALMEMSPRRRRLGDFLGNTIVARRDTDNKEPDLNRRAGATRRTLAFLLDAISIVVFSYGALLAIPASRDLIAVIALTLLPGTILLLVSFSEGVFHTTFGKAIFGLKVCREDGSPAPMAAALVRNFFRITDMNPLGYFCTFVSSQKQRPGDILAGTLVLPGRNGVRGWMAVPYMLILAAIAGFLGLQNPDSAWKQKLDLKIGPYVVDPFTVPMDLLSKTGLAFGPKIVYLETGLNETELSDTFTPGQVVYLVLDATSFEIRDDLANLQVDLRVTDATETLILDQKNIIDVVLPLKNRTKAKLVTRFALNSAALPGTYRATLVLRDQWTKRETRRTIDFEVSSN